jgi:aspartate racemase
MELDSTERNMRTIGVLGGMGPLATAAFLTTLVRETQGERDQDHPPVVVVSRPSIPDRTAYLLGEGPDPRAELHAGALALRAAGADLLVIPCNTANVWLDEVADAAGLDPIRWLDEAVGKTVAVGSRRVGLLATTGTVRTGLYQELLGAAHIEVVLPTPSEQHVVMRTIYAADGVKATGEVSAVLRSELHRVIAKMVGRGADAILLACTELPFAVDRAALDVPIIDPSVAAARAALAASGASAVVARTTPRGG